MHRSFTVAALFALAGCAHSSLVLLPDEDGGHGAVAVLSPDGTGQETVVGEANSRAMLGKGKPTIRPLGAKGLNPREAALIGSLPPPAKSFTLYFVEGTTDMTATSAPRIEEIRTEIAGRPGADVQVTGHTDTVGSGDDNDVLSQKRAEEIMNLLAERGFDRSIMSAVGRGERELQVETEDNVDSPVNRRVEVIVR